MVSSAPLPWTLRRHTSRPQLKSSFDLKGKTRPLARPSTLNRSARSEVSSSPFRSSTGSLWFRDPPPVGAATPPFTSADASPWMSMPFGAPPPPLRQRRRQRPHIGLDGEMGRLRNVGGDRARGGGKGRGGGDARAAGEARWRASRAEERKEQKRDRRRGAQEEEKNGGSHDGIRGRDERAR